MKHFQIGLEYIDLNLIWYTCLQRSVGRARVKNERHFCQNGKIKWNEFFIIIDIILCCCRYITMTIIIMICSWFLVWEETFLIRNWKEKTFLVEFRWRKLTMNFREQHIFGFVRNLQTFMRISIIRGKKVQHAGVYWIYEGKDVCVCTRGIRDCLTCFSFVCIQLLNQITVWI